jgi:hypothetical protein
MLNYLVKLRSRNPITHQKEIWIKLVLHKKMNKSAVKIKLKEAIVFKVP